MQASSAGSLHSAPASHPGRTPPDNAPADNAGTEGGARQTAGAAPQAPANQKAAIPPELLSHSASSLSSHYGLPASLAGGGGGLRPSFAHAGLPAYPAAPMAAGVSTPLAVDLSLRQAALLQEEIAGIKEANRLVGTKRVFFLLFLILY